MLGVCEIPNFISSESFPCEVCVIHTGREQYPASEAAIASGTPLHTDPQRTPSPETAQAEHLTGITPTWGWEMDARSSCRLPLTWAVLLPGKARTLEWGVHRKLLGFGGFFVTSE